MTNNTTAALTDEQRKAVGFAIELIEESQGHRRTETSKALRALLTSPRAAVSVPHGWKLVPIEPTKEMMDAAGGQAGRFTAKIVYTAMLDAAPAAPVAEAVPLTLTLNPNAAPLTYSALGDGVLSGDEYEAQRVAAQAVDAGGASCKGKNCGETDGVSHSPECVAEHEAAVTGAVAADGAATDELLQLDVLLAKFHEAIWRAGWRAGAGDDDLIDFDLAGKDDAKAIQAHFRAMLAERAAVSPATAESKCTRCGSSTAQACNELGCFYLESGDGEPATADATDYAAIERAELGDPDKKTGIYAAEPDERAGLVRDVFKRHAPVWLNKYPDVCSQIADELFAGASQAAAPTPQQISDYLHMLDAVQREVVEREARALKPTQGAWFAKAQAAAPADAREPSAWVTPEGDRSITQSQKQGMLRDGGAGASSVQPFSIACYAGAVPTDAGEAVALTEEDVERQYDSAGVHIGSGLSRETCPCGFCAKHRYGFNRGAQGGKGGDRG